MADFNSDELVFSSPPPSSPSHARIGEKSIKLLFEHAAADRVSTKKIVKQLKFTDGGIAPGTRIQQTLWVRRLEGARQAWGQDDKKPFTGDDLIRFFAAMIDKMALPANKTAPQRATIIRGLNILLAYGYFKWSDFKMGAHESGRFKAFLDKATTEGRVKQGMWQKRTWIGFAVLSRLVSSFLSHSIKQGTCNWDIPIAKCLSVVLVAALGARSGDVAHTAEYKGEEYVQYRHIELYLDGAPTIANLRATITLEFRKGKKSSDNDETQYRLLPLTTTEHSHMCPIAWLLIHALRHSLVAGTTLQEVLDLAFARSDHQVEWLYPSRPVLTAFDVHKNHHLDLEKPATTKQLRKSIKHMGVVAGMLGRAYMHAVRLGGARDVAQLPSDTADSINTDNVRQFLGHTHTSNIAGTTDHYIGGMHATVYNQRAQHSLEPKGRVPRFVIATGELESRSVTAEKLKGGPTTTTPLPPQTTSRQRRPLADKDVNIPLGADQGINLPAAADAREAVTHPLQNVDPALLTEDDIAEVAAGIAAPAVDELYEMVFPGLAELDKDHTEPDKDDSIVALHTFSDADAHTALDSLTDKAGIEEEEALFVVDGNPAQVYSSAEEFVIAYSKINVVDNATLALAWQKYDTDKVAKATEQYCMFGGSRNEPTPMVHTCSKTPGCGQTEYARGYLKTHEAECSVERLGRYAEAASLADEAAQYACKEEGCDYRPGPGSDYKTCLRTHMMKHRWVTKPCGHGCDPSTVYDTREKYLRHIKVMHSSSKYPAACCFPGCTTTKLHATKAQLEQHLHITHDLEDADSRAPYMPADLLLRKYVASQTCWMEGCNKTPSDSEKMVAHLMTKKHGMTREQARVSIEANAQFEQVPRKPHKKHAISTRDVERQQAKIQKRDDSPSDGEDH